MTRIAPRMTAHARDLRTNATPEERLIWVRLRLVRPRFTRQLPVDRYILDFACRTLRIAVELDGSQHVDSAPDVERTAFLEALGWQVLRYWNAEVRADPDAVAQAILAVVGDTLGPTHPQPLPSREGRRVRRTSA